jgi:hypothetical protein
MPRIEVSRPLPVSLREGFDYITDVGNWRSYWPSLVDIPDEERISWSRPGDRASVVVSVRGRPVEMRMELEDFSPYEHVIYRSVQDGLPEFHHERHWRDRDAGFDYTLVIEFEPRRGVAGLIDRLFVSRTVRGSLEETMDNLERIFSER